MARVSVMRTSWFGSAPWSVSPLAVEVTPKMVTVPSPLTWPVTLRNPLLDGVQGRFVAGFMPVG